MVLVSAPEMSPLPLVAIPVRLLVLSRVQSNVVPATFPVNAIVWITAPEHIVWVVGVAVASGVGLTVTVAVIGVPEHPFAVGVMVKVTVCMV